MYSTKKLSEITKLIMWQSPTSDTYNSEWKWLPFYQWKKEFWEVYPTPEVWCSDPIKIVEKWDVLISVRAPVWPINLCNETSCIGRWLAGIRPKLELLELWYLRYYFKKYETKISKLWKWSTFASITKSDLETLEIPLPPLSTQSRIVARLDSAFASIDEQISLLRANIADVENIGKSSLDIVFQNDSEEKIPLWTLLQIKHWYAFSGEWFSENWKFLLLTPWNFSKKDWLILREKKEKYFIGDFPKEFLLRKWDLLIAMTDLSSSAPILWAPWFVTQDNMLHNQRLWLIENLSESLSENYLYYFFQSNIYRSKVKLTATGTTVRHTAPKRIYEIQIPLPPLSRQHEIVAHLDRVFAETQALRGEYEAQIRDLEILKQSLLKEAFAGRLVTDEV